MLRVDVDVNNLPTKIGKDNVWLVVRVADDKSYWYYGAYDTELRAYAAAREIGNGVVMRLV